ncbi:unnamed protein product [Caenorhabditis auriculariae]|uniref:SSD domain-containing protein n=1 Tax=Caenorhabditis auriculariae TaxID=2777116 RepID=A0A8S1H900_9PELO|nr:unnamed protein product [Caenorhabditis auriculariae]
MSSKLKEPAADLLKILQKWAGGSVRFEKHPKVKGRLNVVLDRPDKGNCLSGAMMCELGRGVEHLESREHGVVVLSGKGSSFCTGADLGLIKDISDASLGGPMFDFMSSVLQKLNVSPAISVAHIRGHCLGGATEICSAVDIRVAHVDSKIGFLQSRLGIIPSWGGAYYLEAILGRSKALHVMSSASVLSAEDAFKLGWLDFVYREEAEAEQYINGMCRTDPGLTQAQKEMLNAVKHSHEAQKEVLNRVWKSSIHKKALEKQLAAEIPNRKVKRPPLVMRWDLVERRAAKSFAALGRLITDHPVPFLVFPVLFTAAMGVGMLHLNSLTDAVYLFTPVGAQSKMERLAVHEKWPLTSDNYIPGRAVTQSREIQVTALAKNDGNILETRYAEAVYRLDKFIQTRIRILHDGRYYGYKDLCLQYKGGGCSSSKHVHILSDFYNHGFNITYPYFRFGTEGGYLGSSLGGVSLMKNENGTEILASAHAWFMVYHLKFHPEELSYISGQWENEMVRQLRDYPEDPYISITYFHSQTLADELKRNADTLIPRFVVAFTLLVVFSMACSMSFIDKTFYIDWVLSKPILSILGVISAGMAILTGIGSLALLGMPYNDIVGVMPFLVVAVGTDNMFLMVSAVRRTSRTLPAKERMSECLSDAAVSILITSSTDVLSFGVGTITTIPAVQIFCIYTGVSIFFTFIYQITFFSACLAVYTKFEEQGRNSAFVVATVNESKKDSVSLISRLFNLGSAPKSKAAHDIKEPATARFFGEWYAPVLMNPIVRALAMIWFVIYLVFAGYGCSKIKEGLEPVNLLVQDSYAIPHYRLLEKYFWKYGAQLQIVVNNAPDFREPSTRDRIHAMVGDFATSRHAIGLESVDFWLFDMERYYMDQLQMPVIDTAFYGLLGHFLASKHNNPLAEDLYWGKDENGTDVVESFRFVIGMRDIVTTMEQTDATLSFREIASRWPEYNVTTFMPLWLFTDQYVLIIPNTVQNIIIALMVMILIALVLIPQPMCSIWVALACASIDFGVVGYMTLWGVNLDAISMITIIMSIGFSVDYSAHITYGYVVSTADTPSDRVRDALSALGWPLFQGALSTIIAVIVLADIPAYMMVTFFKTVVLAISLGLLHGLVFLPVLLSLFVRGCCIMTVDHDKKEKSREVYVIEKGMRISDVSSSTGYETGSSVTTSSPIGSAPRFEFVDDSPIVHNRSRSVIKSPEHID